MMIAPQPNTQRARRTPLSYDSRNDRLVYGSGKLVVLRSVQDPTEATVYSEHTKPVSAVSISPSGFYGASADPSGQVYVWSTEGDLVTKGPYSGVQVPNDLAWDFESKRLIVVGDGKEKFGAAITADSGNTVGEITGHATQINAVSIRPKRPFRAVTVDDDKKVAFFHGVPFKFQKFCAEHTGSVSDVKYHPSGDSFVTVGMDKKVFIWDGDNGNLIQSIETGHTGGILAVDWLGDKVVTASTDKSVRVTAKDGTQEIFQLSANVSNQQLGVVVTKDFIISVGLDGTLYYWKEGQDTPVKVVSGHQKAVTALAVKENLYTASIEGSLLKWTSGVAEVLPAHSAPVTTLVATADSIWSSGWDKRLLKHGSDSEIELEAQPIDVAIDGSDFAAISENLLQYKAKSIEVPRSQAIDLHNGKIAVGSGNRVSLYDTDLKLLNKSLEPLRADISALKFSPDGSLLAAGDNSGKIIVFNVENGSILTTRWAFHTTTVKSISWHPSGKYAVTGGSDCSIYVYSVTRPARNLKFLDAHKDGVNVVDWYKEGIVSGGADGTIKTWNVELSKLF